MIPVFTYAVAESVKENCPTLLDNKTLEPNDWLPCQASNTDTGYDVRCAETNLLTLDDGSKVKGIELYPGCYFKMTLGIRALIPEGWWLYLCPRSGSFLKNHIHGHYGIIDQNYENYLCFAGQFILNNCELIEAKKRWIIPFGQRVAQLLPMPRYSQGIVSCSNQDLDEKFKARQGSRGIGGFGSSGRA